MASYKVPQDVEAEDKLVGPLSFRQFVYAIIAIAGAAVAFFLFQALPPLVIIPLPIIVLFGILALPLRKDQPMETYLLALLRFYLKSKQRLWNPDGTISYVEITVPKTMEQHLTKEIGGMAAKERLNYLASVMDTRGWALKGVTGQPTPSVTTDVAVEAQSAPDIMNENEELSRSFDSLIAKNAQQRREKAMDQMKKATVKKPEPKAESPKPRPRPQTEIKEPEIIAPEYNPYPSAIHQKIVHPVDEPAPKKTDQTSDTSAMTPQPAPVIIDPATLRLASNDDLSISAIAHEAHRLEDKNKEVVIKLH